ncbi:Uncharacterised protein [Yersinia enterocolitica]|nr:Uncharacterised protein [Yersinia enterocolitica]
MQGIRYPFTRRSPNPEQRLINWPILSDPNITVTLRSHRVLLLRRTALVWTPKLPTRRADVLAPPPTGAIKPHYLDAE